MQQRLGMSSVFDLINKKKCWTLMDSLMKVDAGQRLFPDYASEMTGYYKPGEERGKPPED